MATIALPIPARDFDPSEIAVSWQELTRRGHRVIFATPDGQPGRADRIMIDGIGLDPWGCVPLLRRVRVFGLLLRANRAARAAYAAMIQSAEFLGPRRWNELAVEDIDGLLLGGGHRARGMRPFLESAALQYLVAGFFAADKPVAAICHGVLLVARSRRADGRSVLHGRRTTALTWRQERAASAIARVGRWWDSSYYRTYPDGEGQPAGHMSVEAEVTRALADPADFRDVPDDAPDAARKTGLARDTADDARAAWVVMDGNYVSARWPGDAHAFAAAFDALLARRA